MLPLCGEIKIHVVVITSEAPGLVPDVMRDVITMYDVAS